MDKIDETFANTLLSRNEIPIIDLANVGSVTATTKSWLQDIGNQMNHALSTKGLVFLVNHGISEERLQSVHKIMDTFCALPDDVKHLYKVNPPNNPQGYIPAGMEKLDCSAKREERQCYNIQRFSGKLPREEIPNFIEVVGGVAEEFLTLSCLILKIIAVALDLDPEVFLSFHKGMMKEDNLTTIRMLYYPPVGEAPPANITRCGEHSDWGTFTLLSQDVEGGLEVLNGREWGRVGHLPGAIMLNLGDLMESWSSSQYKAIKHRVIIPEETKLRTKGRHSIAFFVHPDDSTMADPSFFTRCRSGEELEESKGLKTALNAYEYAQKKLLESFQ